MKEISKERRCLVEFVAKRPSTVIYWWRGEAELGRKFEEKKGAAVYVAGEFRSKIQKLR